MTRTLLRLSCALLLCAHAMANGHYSDTGMGFPGVVIRSDQRFDPMIQRLLARAELKALAIGETGLLYLVPVTQDPYQQELQIRHLHELLEERANEPDPDDQ